MKQPRVTERGSERDRTWTHNLLPRLLLEPLKFLGGSPRNPLDLLALKHGCTLKSPLDQAEGWAPNGESGAC
jgi:hypothetical protein